MEVNNAVLKLIIKECCRSSLLYNDEERQFMFPLKPGLNSIWPEIKSVIHTEHPDFHLSDFNQLLARLCDLRNQYTKIEVIKCISDTLILTGEVLELSLVDKSIPLRLIKMKEGQYLNANIGKGYTFGKNIEFINGYPLKTSEGKVLGTIKSIAWLCPSIEHIVLSKLFIGSYYKNKIADSIWPIFDKIVNYNPLILNTDLNDFLLMSRKMGINSFTLLNILNAGIYYGNK